MHSGKNLPHNMEEGPTRTTTKPLDVPSSYRPLFLLNCAGKLLEKVIDNRLRCFLDSNDGLDDRQFDLHRGRSTTDAVNCLSKIVEENHPKYRTGMLTLDIINAFNSTPWATTLKTLKLKIYYVHLPTYRQLPVKSDADLRLRGKRIRHSTFMWRP